MKRNLAQVFSVLALIVFTGSVVAQSSSELNGKWSMKKKTDHGEVTQELDFKNDVFNFRILNAEGNTAFFAKGKVKLEKLGPFKSMKLTNIEWGGSESDLESSGDERTIIYTIRYSNLILANNFDKEREDEEPSAESYSKVSK